MKKYVLLAFILLASGHAAWAAAPTAPDYYKAGNQFYAVKDYSQAVSCLQAAVELNSSFWQAYQMLGEAYYQQGDIPNALDALHQSLKLHPNNPALQVFADRIGQMAAAHPVAVKPMAGPTEAKPEEKPAWKDGHLFVNALSFYSLPLNGALGKANQVWQGVESNYTDTFDTYTQNVFGAGCEVGYAFDKKSALGFSVYGSTSTSGPGLNIGYPQGNATSGGQETLQAGLTAFELRYYRYLTDPSGRWFGYLGAGYYSVACAASQSSASPVDSTDTSYATQGNFTGSAMGAVLGVGRQFDLFKFLSIEASVGFQYADVTQVSGTYTSTETQLASKTSSVIATGQGTLVTLSNGSIAIANKTNPGPGTQYTPFDLTGFVGRAAINIWL